MKRLLVVLVLLLISTVPAEAGYKAGIRAARVQDFARAFKEFETLVEQGHSGAQFNLGVMYLHARGVERDFDRAFALFHKAAAQGHSGAMNNIGRLYVEGKQVERDYAKAVRWFRKAAKNHALARNNLAQMYLTGRGVGKDYKKGLFWLLQAARKGHAKSLYEIGIIHDNGLGVVKNREKAIHWISRSAGKGYRKAVNWMARLEMEMREAERKRKIAAVAYSCPQVPRVSWWGDVGHGDIINEVRRKHLRNWSIYAAKWSRHLNGMKETRAAGGGIRLRKSSVDLSSGEFREAGAVGTDVVVLGGADLDRYIVKVTKRIDVHRCLAGKVKTRAVSENMEPVHGTSG